MWIEYLYICHRFESESNHTNLKFNIMKSITYRTLKTKIENGQIEMQADIWGAQYSQYASIVRISNQGKRSDPETVAVVGLNTTETDKFFNIQF